VLDPLELPPEYPPMGTQPPSNTATTTAATSRIFFDIFFPQVENGLALDAPAQPPFLDRRVDRRNHRQGAHGPQ
jgi:hypothetical protein